MPEPYETDTGRLLWSARYHVPRSQVWEGSRGRAHGSVHLHLPLGPTPTPGEPRPKVELTATTGRKTTILRSPASPLCGKGRGWYERPALDHELTHERCPRCVALADRYGVEWPTAAVADVGDPTPRRENDGTLAAAPNNQEPTNA